MLGSLIALLVLIAGGTTVVVSDDARPGETLFTIDQAVEDIRLSIAPESKKTKLKIQFAEERVEELQEAISESSDDEDDTNSSDSENGLEIEADVFTDITIVKIEKNNTVEFLQTQTTEQGALISEIAAHLNITNEEVARAFSFEVEDRASRAEDTVEDSFSNDSEDESNDDSDDDSDIEETVNLTILYAQALLAEENDSPEFAAFLASLSETLSLLPKNLQTKIDIENEGFGNSNDDIIKFKSDDDGRIKYESRSDDGRVKIEVKKDGEVKIQSKSSNDDDSSDDSGDDVSDDSDDDGDEDKDEDNDSSDDDSEDSEEGNDNSDDDDNDSDEGN